MALGAQPGLILRLFFREATTLLCAGLAVGIPVALAASRLVSSMFFGVSPASLTSIALPAAILVFAGLLATYIPAQRASKVEPIIALRAE
jgi:putative ABC transport system permease protein